MWPAAPRWPLGAIDGDHPDSDQVGLGAELKDLAKQLGKRALVALAKARDRRVVGRLVGADHARRDVLHAAALQPPRGALADRVTAWPPLGMHDDSTAAPAFRPCRRMGSLAETPAFASSRASR
jgi:hypothetical protein